jgi:hypothetical protein
MVTSSANSPRYNGSISAALPLSALFPLPRVQRPLPRTNQTNQWSIALRAVGAQLGPQGRSQSMTAQSMISSLCSAIKAAKAQPSNPVKPTVKQ